LSYLAFLRENWRFLAFGLLLTSFSGPGQTYFIAMFSAQLRAEFELSHGGFGLVYSLATLASGLSLMWVGRQIDNLSLRLYSVCISSALIAACFVMATVSSVVMLCLAIFALRLAGQGLMTHASVTSMARYFEKSRGKAISIASLGLPAGTAVFPLVVVTLIAAVGWRQTWIVVGTALLVLLIPLVLWLLKGHDMRHRRYLERAAGSGTGGAFCTSGWSRRDVLSDYRFYMLIPGILAPSFILTGLFFHQVHLAEAKGWSLAWLASTYIGFSTATVIALLFAGPLIDRMSAVRLVPFNMLPLGVGLLVLASFDDPRAGLVFMVASGITMGASFSVVGALWAEFYGVIHLGAVRALVSALQILATALSPVSMGWLFDAGVTIEAIALMCMVYVVAGTGLIVMVPRRAALGSP